MLLQHRFNSRTLGRVRHQRQSDSACGAGFNSRTLGRVRLIPLVPQLLVGDVSIHAPWEGCDTNANGGSARCTDVSIHAPWEGCDSTLALLVAVTAVVSIHAPWEGCDYLRLGRPRGVGVSIHAPWEGCDPSALKGLLRCPLFQFTHPGKGATRCDQSTRLGSMSFNSRTLGRVRLCHRLEFAWSLMFQFTHPGKGATVWCKVAYYRADKQA